MPAKVTCYWQVASVSKIRRIGFKACPTFQLAQEKAICANKELGLISVVSSVRAILIRHYYRSNDRRGTAAIPSLPSESGPSNSVKGFGRRQAYESLRRPNPRATSDMLWGFQYTAGLGAGAIFEGRRRVCWNWVASCSIQRPWQCGEQPIRATLALMSVDRM